jgi:hypothetical protein
VHGRTTWFVDHELRRGRASRRDRRPGARDGIGSERLLLALLAGGVFALYLALEQGRIPSWDGRAIASVGQSLYLHGSVKECCNAFRAFPLDHLQYSKYGIGLSLLLAPLWGLQLHTHPNGATWLGLANPLLLVGTTVLIAKTGLALRWRTSTAVLSALAFALLTMAPMYSTEFFAEPGVTFGATLALYGFVEWPRESTRAGLLVGLGVAIAVVFRADSLLLVTPIVPALALHGGFRVPRAIWLRRIAGLAVPIGAAVAWTLAYDRIRFGNPLSFGYNGPYDRLGFSTPLLHGIAVLLWSPGKSLFVYSPILLVALPGLWFLARTHRPVAIAVVLLCVVRVCFVARWWTPEGGEAWGPRFLLPLCALLAIPLGAAIERLRRTDGAVRVAAVAAVCGLVAASVVVQFASVAVPYQAVFGSIFDVRSVPVPLRHATEDARYRRYIWTFGGNHVVWNLEHLASQRWADLYWFRHGPTVFGVAMLLLAAAGCVAAVVLALRFDDGMDAPPTLRNHE